MALPPLVVPLFPNVPIAAGVPPILRSAGFPTPNVSLVLDSDGLSIVTNGPPPVWGVFSEDGDPLVVADTIYSQDYGKSFRISNFPIEGGKFASYNKTEDPADGRFTLVKGGTPEEQAEFLASVDELVTVLELVVLVTPQASYRNMNAIKYDYGRRREKGANLTVVDILFEQVRIAPDATYSNAKEPNGQDTVDNGPVRPQAPTAAQGAAIGPVA